MAYNSSIKDFIKTHSNNPGLSKFASEDKKEEEKKKEKSDKEKEEEKKKEKDKKEGKKEDKKEEKKASTSIEEAYHRASEALPPQLRADLELGALMQSINIGKQANIINDTIERGDRMYSKSASARSAVMDVINSGKGKISKVVEGLKGGAKAGLETGFDSGVERGNNIRSKSTYAYDHAMNTAKELPGFIDKQVMGLGDGLNTARKNPRSAMGMGSSAGTRDYSENSSTANRVAGYGAASLGAGALGAAGYGIKQLLGKTKVQTAIADHIAVDVAKQQGMMNAFGDNIKGAYNTASNSLRQGATNVMNTARNNPYAAAGIGAGAIGAAGLGAYAMTKEQSENLYTEGYYQCLADLGINPNQAQNMQKSASLQELAEVYAGQIFDDLYSLNLKKEASYFEHASSELLK
jgi:hypothetical protein